MYILQCADGSYYTGSTNNLELRLAQHQTGEGANHTKKRLPVKLVYYEEYQRIDEAFYREKQVQGWRREKKEALIRGDYNLLPELAIAYRDLDTVASSTSATESASATEEITLPEALEGSVKKTLEGSEKAVSSRASETAKTRASETAKTKTRKK